MTTEVLPLRHVPAPTQGDCATRPIAEQILRAFRTMFTYAEVGVEYDTVDAQLAARSAALNTATNRTAIAQIGDSIVDACRAAVAAVARRQELRRHDIESLVAVVRQTVDSLASGHDRFSSSAVLLIPLEL